MRVLVIEDDQKLGSFVQTGLEQEGDAVDVLNDGADAGAQARDDRLRRGRPRSDAAGPLRVAGPP